MTSCSRFQENGSPGSVTKEITTPVDIAPINLSPSRDIKEEQPEEVVSNSKASTKNF